MTVGVSGGAHELREYHRVFEGDESEWITERADACNFAFGGLPLTQLVLWVMDEDGSFEIFGDADFKVKR